MCETVISQWYIITPLILILPSTPNTKFGDVWFVTTLLWTGKWDEVYLFTSTGWIQKSKDFVSRGFPPTYETKVSLTLYRIEAMLDNNVVLLMLRVMDPDQNGDNRMCILICHMCTTHRDGGVTCSPIFRWILRIRTWILLKCRKEQRKKKKKCTSPPLWYRSYFSRNSIYIFLYVPVMLQNSFFQFSSVLKLNWCELRAEI